MVQRRPNHGSSVAAGNPFDSDDEPSPRYSKNRASSSYANPFDDDDHEVQKKPTTKLEQQNPFDDDAVWKKNSSQQQQFSADDPAADKRKHSSTKQQQQQQQPQFLDDEPVAEKQYRRRDVVKERITSLTEDVANKANKAKQTGVDFVVRPRSKNLMAGGGGGTQNRKLLLGDQHEEQQRLGVRSDQTKADHARIDRAMKDRESLDGESVQELESYGLHKAEETTSAVYNALKLAEEIKEGATKTVIQIHHQGEQIRQTHETAANIDHELSRGEKLLGSLGGLFSRTWKPKKGRAITGPVITRGDSFKRKAYGLEQRNALGLVKTRASTSTRPNAGGSQFQSQIQNEFAKQDDALSDLSNVIGQLKEMSMDMGTEIGRQTHDLDNLELDVTELGHRVDGANQRARRLLGR